MSEIYDLLTLNTLPIKIIPNPSYGVGPIICGPECALEIHYADEPIPLENITCHIHHSRKCINLSIKDSTNYIIYKGGASAVAGAYIKTNGNKISDKYVLIDIFIFFDVRNYIEEKTNINDFEVQLLHKSENDICIATVIHINDKGSTSVESSLYETIFNSIVMAAKNNNHKHKQTLSDLCKSPGITCMTSVIPSNFTIDNTQFPIFYSWLDLHVGYKLYWVAFDKSISISSTIFSSIFKYMNSDIKDLATERLKQRQYTIPKMGELIYYKIGGITYNRKHYLYISLGGAEIPEYAQDKYGKYPDKPDDSQDSGKGQCNKSDNVVVVNATPHEKIIIEVDNKIRETFSNIMNTVKETFSTIDIKETLPNQPVSYDNTKNIIICVLISIIILYIVYRLYLYTKSNNIYGITYMITYIKIIMSKIFNKLNIFSSSSPEIFKTGGDTSSDESRYDPSPGSSHQSLLPDSSPDKYSGQQEIEKKVARQMGGAKYKLGLKKIKRKLI